MSSTRKTPRVSTRVRTSRIATRTTVTTTAHVPTTTTVRVVSATIVRPTTTTASRSMATNINSRPTARSATNAVAVGRPSTTRPIRRTSSSSSSTASIIPARSSRLAPATTVPNAVEENQPVTTQNVSTRRGPLLDIAENTANVLSPFNQNTQNIMMRDTPSRRAVVSCPVCFMTNLELNLYTMSCGHIFCYNCIMQATNCYVCRAVVNKSSIHILYII